MKCKCGSNRVCSVVGHCQGRFVSSMGKEEYIGYVPEGFNLGGVDDLSFDICLDCGQVQGEWPKEFPQRKLPTWIGKKK